jgi:hypothetical protein
MLSQCIRRPLLRQNVTGGVTPTPAGGRGFGGVGVRVDLFLPWGYPCHSLVSLTILLLWPSIPGLSVLPFHGCFGLTFPGLLARFFRPFLANFSRHFPLTISYTHLCYYNDNQ